jgi:hypothetical protein
LEYICKEAMPCFHIDAIIPRELMEAANYFDTAEEVQGPGWYPRDCSYYWTSWNGVQLAPSAQRWEGYHSCQEGRWMKSRYNHHIGR